MKTYLIILFAVVLLVGCKIQQPSVIEVPIQYKEKIVERLVPVNVPADSSAITALFECDSLNQVVLKQLDEEKTKRIQSAFNFNNGKLNYKTITEHDTVFVAVTDSTIYKEVPVKVEVPVITNKLTSWQTGQIHIGRLFLTILMAYGVYRFLKWKLKLI